MDQKGFNIWTKHNVCKGRPLITHDDVYATAVELSGTQLLSEPTRSVRRVSGFVQTPQDSSISAHFDVRSVASSVVNKGVEENLLGRIVHSYDIAYYGDVELTLSGQRRYPS